MRTLDPNAAATCVARGAGHNSPSGGGGNEYHCSTKVGVVDQLIGGDDDEEASECTGTVQTERRGGGRRRGADMARVQLLFTRKAALCFNTTLLSVTSKIQRSLRSVVFFRSNPVCPPKRTSSGNGKYTPVKLQLSAKRHDM